MGKASLSRLKKNQGVFDYLERGGGGGGGGGVGGGGGGRRLADLRRASILRCAGGLPLKKKK